MERVEIQRIADFLSDVYEGICEGDEFATMHLHLSELYRIIKTLMDATFEAKEPETKVMLALLEKRAREYKAEIESRLAVRN